MSSTKTSGTPGFWSSVERWITLILERIRWPAAVILFLMALLTTVDVVGRYVFDKPIKAGSEIQELMMVVIVFLGAGYCTIKRRQATADLIVVHLSKHTRAVIDSVTWFLCAVIFSLISWQITKWGFSEVITPTRITLLLGIKQGPIILVAALGCIGVCVGSLVNFIQSLAEARTKKEAKL